MRFALFNRFPCHGQCLFFFLLSLNFHHMVFFSILFSSNKIEMYLIQYITLNHIYWNRCWLTPDPGPFFLYIIGKYRKWPKPIERHDSFLFFSFYESNKQIDTKKTFVRSFDRFHVVVFFQKRWTKFARNIFFSFDNKNISPTSCFSFRVFLRFLHRANGNQTQCVNAHFGFVHNYEYCKWTTKTWKMKTMEKMKRKKKKYIEIWSIPIKLVFHFSLSLSRLGIVSIMTAEGENSDDSRQLKALNIEHMQWLQVECLGLIFSLPFFSAFRSLWFFLFWILCLIFVFRCLILIFKCMYDVWPLQCSPFHMLLLIAFK